MAEIDVDDVDVLVGRLFRWLTNPKRKLPTGMTLGELAQSKEDLDDYEDHADRQLGAFVGQMEDEGVRFGLLRTACHGALACSGWWAHPAWSESVERFVSILDSPEDQHWGPGGEWHKKLAAEPLSVQDRGSLRATLLKSPWKLDSEAAEWITDAGIGYMASTTAPDQDDARYPAEVLTWRLHRLGQRPAPNPRAQAARARSTHAITTTPQSARPTAVLRQPAPTDTHRRRS